MKGASNRYEHVEVRNEENIMVRRHKACPLFPLPVVESGHTVGPKKNMVASSTVPIVGLVHGCQLVLEVDDDDDDDDDNEQLNIALVGLHGRTDLYL
jgi:hypothetical protein